MLMLGAVAGALSPQFADQSEDRLFTARQVVVANAGSGATSLVSQDTLKVTRGEVPIAAVDKLKVLAPRLSAQDPDKLAARMDAAFDSKTSSITISSNDVVPDAAGVRVEAFVQAFLEVTNGRIQAGDRSQLEQTKTDVAALNAELAAFDVQYPQLNQPGLPVAVGDVFTSNLLAARRTLLDRVATLEADQRNRELALLRNLPYSTLGAEVPKPAVSGLIDVPSSRPVRAGLIGLLGFMLGAGLAMLIERVGRRIDTREELAEITDLPILAEIGFVPTKRRAVDASGQVSLEGVWAEPYRRVRSAIQFVQANSAASGWIPQPGAPSQVLDTSPAVFLVTSTSPAEGKSTTAALVALALAEVGVPTVLIGGDFRKPQVDRLIGAQRSPSLQDLASLDVDRPAVDEVVQSTAFNNLYVATAGDATREVAGLVEAAKSVCLEAVARGGTVIIDSSPLQAANDTLDLLPAVDYVILVVRVGKSSESDFLDTVATLRRMETNLLGVVLIGTPAGRKQEYYYDYYSHPPVAIKA